MVNGVLIPTVQVAGAVVEVVTSPSGTVTSPSKVAAAMPWGGGLYCGHGG